jgi:arylsulfatase A
MMDILPTFAALAGAKLPEGRKLDGVDLSSTLFESPEEKPARDHFYYFRGFTLEAVRSGPWKLHLKSGELYHLGDDIGEAKNVAADQTEVVAHLRQMADAMKEDLGVEGIGAGCRPLGRVEDPQPLINAEGRIRAGFEP